MTLNQSRAGSVRGLAALAIPILIGVTGCAGQKVVVRDDAAITQDVQARLAADSQTKPYAIKVATTGGVVNVTGAVAKPADRDTVERIARDTPGVRSVDNGVRYGGAPTPVGGSTP